MAKASNLWKFSPQKLYFHQFAKAFSAKLEVWRPLAWQKQAICESFLRKNCIFINSRKFSPLKVFRYTVYTQLCNMCKRRCIKHKIHVQPRIAEAYEHRKAAWRSVQLPYINPLSNLAPPKQGCMFPHTSLRPSRWPSSGSWESILVTVVTSKLINRVTCTFWSVIRHRTSGGS